MAQPRATGHNSTAKTSPFLKLPYELRSYICQLAASLETGIIVSVECSYFPHQPWAALFRRSPPAKLKQPLPSALLRLDHEKLCGDCSASI